jgi:two-component system sensor histidine kinase/response regulator
MNDHVAKPIDPEILFNALLKWIKPGMAVVKSEQPLTQHANSTEADPLHQLQSINGLNVQLGLKRVMGKKPLYLNMLNKYVETGIQSLTDLKAAVEANNSETAERIAHTLKGTNGNIGATDLQTLADRIEKRIKEQADFNILITEVAALTEAQTGMVEAIANAINISKPAPDPESAAGHQAKQLTQAIDPKLLEQFIIMLKDNDTQAITQLEQHTEVFRAHFTPALYEKINRALLEFDFEQALTLTTH